MRRTSAMKKKCWGSEESMNEWKFRGIFLGPRTFKTLCAQSYSIQMEA